MAKFLLNLATAVLIPHFDALFRQLDPIQEDESFKNIPKLSKFVLNRQFALCFLNLAFTFVNGNFVLHYLSAGYRESWSLESLMSNPNLLIHQMFPPQTWLLTDPCLVLNFIVDCAIFLYLTFYSSMDENFRFLPKNNGMNLMIDSRSIYNRNFSFL